MINLFLTLLSLSGLCVSYGIVKIFLLAHEYNLRRQVFDRRVEGRKMELRNNKDRRLPQLIALK